MGTAAMVKSNLPGIFTPRENHSTSLHTALPLHVCNRLPHVRRHAYGPVWDRDGVANEQEKLKKDRRTPRDRRASAGRVRRQNAGFELDGQKS